MSGHLMPFSYGAPRLPRAVQQELDRVAYRGMITGARMTVIGTAARMAMFETAVLSNFELELIKVAPLAERRLDAIVNTASTLLMAEVARVAGGWL